MAMAKRVRKAGSGDGVAALEERLHYHFQRRRLLELALTHSSLAFEAGNGTPNRTDEDNEQLEFLGDAVLELAVTELLFRHFGERREGDLTRMRAMLVSRKNMGEVGARLKLGDSLRLGRGEEASGGRTKPALLANTLEAVIAAVYLDAAPDGYAQAKALIEREIFDPNLPRLKEAAKQGARFGGAIGDWKSALQELLQARGEGQPQYRTINETGDAHSKHFQVEVIHGATVVAAGEGSSKKAAQQNAAQAAYRVLSEGAADARNSGADAAPFPAAGAPA